jgi:uncharacterized protein
MAFPCNSCGLCCQHVDRSDVTSWMDRGDGICLYLGKDMCTCSIYDARPACCRVDESYVLFADVMGLVEYYEANTKICDALRIEHNFV